MQKALVELENEGLVYTERTKDINLKIPRGKIVGLLGKNGMGKTT